MKCHGDVIYSITTIINNALADLKVTKMVNLKVLIRRRNNPVVACDDRGWLGLLRWSFCSLYKWSSDESLCCTLETNIMLYVNYSSV